MITEQTKAELNRLEIFEDIVEAVAILKTRPGGEWLGSMFLFSTEASIRSLTDRINPNCWPPLPRILTIDDLRDRVQPTQPIEPAAGTDAL